MRRKPFDSHSDKQDKLDESIEKHREKQKEKNKEKDQSRDQNNQEQQKQDRKENPEKTHEHPEGQQPENAQSNAEGQPDASSETIFATGENYQIKQLAPEFIRADRKGSGRRSKTFTSSRQGRYIKSAIPHALFAVGSVLFIITFLINLIADMVKKRYRFKVD